MRLLVLALLLPACGTTRLYEGAELPEGQSVHLEEWLSWWDLRRTQFLELDGQVVDQGFWDSDFEFAPGPHVIVAQATIPSAWSLSEMVFGDRCTLSFTAEPGVTYELRTDESETHPPLNLFLLDTRNDRIVVDNEPDGWEDCLTADVDWGGRTWVADEHATNATHNWVKFVPEGRTLEDTDEWVELHCVTGLDAAPDVDEIKAKLWEKWEDIADDPNMSVLAREEGAAPSLLLVFNGEIDDQQHRALVKLRTSDKRLHVLMWVRAAADIPQADLDQWTALFEQARLHEPKAR